MNGFTLSGTVYLPDGRAVDTTITGYSERDTNSFVETGVSFSWCGGDELTAEEICETVAKGYFLHEFCMENIEFAPNFKSEATP